MKKQMASVCLAALCALVILTFSCMPAQAQAMPVANVARQTTHTAITGSRAAVTMPACRGVEGGMQAIKGVRLLASASAKEEYSSRARDDATELENTPFYRSDEDEVYVTKTGKCYHAIPDCGTTKYPYPISTWEAIRLGYDACERCDPMPVTPLRSAPKMPEDDPRVYLIIQDPYYHRSDTCSAIKDSDGVYTPVIATLSEGRYLDKLPCKHCDAPD